MCVQKITSAVGRPTAIQTGEVTPDRIRSGMRVREIAGTVGRPNAIQTGKLILCQIRMCVQKSPAWQQKQPWR